MELLSACGPRPAFQNKPKQVPIFSIQYHGITNIDTMPTLRGIFASSNRTGLI